MNLAKTIGSTEGKLASAQGGKPQISARTKASMSVIAWTVDSLVS
jgi:hypothetical protein